MIKKMILLLFFTAFLCSCTEDKEIDPLEEIVKQIFLFEHENIDLSTEAFNNINCYIFKDSLFHKVLRNINLDNDKRIIMDVPKMAKLYFLTNMEEPYSFTFLEENKTDLSSFLSMHSNDISINPQGKVTEFYSGMAIVDPSLGSNKGITIKLCSSVSRIDIDASSDELIQIDSIEIIGASSNTQLFVGEKTIFPINRQSYSRNFKPAISGIVTDIFRLYESNMPVNFIIKGTYNKVPFIIYKSINKLERNKIYTIKIENKDIEIVPGNNVYIITPDSRGLLNMSTTQASLIQPGSTIFLKGIFLAVRITGLKGNAKQPIRITNYPGKTLVVGNPNWNGGGGSSAIQLLECQHIILGGENNTSDFNVEGSIQSEVQSAYFGVNLRPFTDNVEVKNMTIRNGGTGIMAKTDPEKNNPKTWYPNSQLENLSIHNVVITGTKDEGMYIGHTAIWWGWDETGRGYNAGAEPNNPAHSYAMPIKWKNVKIYNNYVHQLGYDGIQASAIDQLEIYGNEIANYGMRATYSQCSGLIVGGRTTNTNVHDNYVHDGFGEIFQFHGANEKNSPHILHNNLFANTQSSGMGIYGVIDAATIKISNNTVVNCQLFAIQANGKYYETNVKLYNNVFIACYQKDPSLVKYIRVMNDAIVEEKNNKLYYSLDSALVDPNNFYQPLPSSPIGDAGYKRVCSVSTLTDHHSHSK